MPPPPANTTAGVANGSPTSNSGGPGKGGGIGTGDGPGVGSKSGAGGGDTPGGGGPGGGTRSGPLGRPDGITLTGPIDYALLKTLPGSTGIIWISRVRPIVTPEAQVDKVVGYVLLEATFNADGTITDIRVRQSLGTMDAAAIESLRKARFRPATDKEGRPITLLRVPIKVNVNMS
jgi:periplasmic protein TonB